MSALFADVVTSEAAQPASQATHRSAALLLHSLSESDRAWALSRLEPGQRGQLDPLLEELAQLGVPRDPAWVRQVLAETSPSPSPSVRADSLLAPRDRIASADPQAVASLLLKEPRGLVQRVLALGPWPWSEAVRSTLRLHRGDLFEPSVATPPALASTTPALEQALLAQLAQALDSLSPPPGARARGAVVRPGLAQRFANLLAGRVR